MLNYIGNTSPECLIFPDQALNLPAPVPEQITTDIQSLVVTSVLKQHNKEKNYTHEIRDDKRSVHSFLSLYFSVSRSTLYDICLEELLFSFR